MKRFVWLVIGVMSSAFFIHDSKATVAGKEKIIIDEDAEIEQLVKEAVKNYVPKKLPRAAKSKKTKATASITPSMYAAHYFYKPFKQPLVDLPSLLRKTAVTSEIEFSAHAAQNSYGPSGSRENLASRVFGKKDIQVQDLALVTRLAAKPGVAILQNSHNKDDFAQLAPIPVQFDAFTHREQVQLGASFACLEKKLRFNVGLPIVVGTNQLKVANDAGLQRVVNGVLAGDFKDYSLAQFIDALTSDMKMESKMGDRITSYGLGQGFIGATYQLPVKQLDQAHIGVQLYVPTTTKSDAKHVWPVELGIHNVALAVNTVLLWEKRRFFNPYVHANGRINCAAKATWRVPRVVSRGASALPAEKMALGSWVQYDGANDFNNEIEASVRGFSDFDSDVTTRLGHSFMLQVGNIFERVIDKGGYLDLAYRFNLKLKDEVISVQPEGSYYTDPLTANTDEIAHQLRLGYGYHFTDHFRLSVLGSFVFAGKNTAQTLGLTALLGFSF